MTLCEAVSGYSHSARQTEGLLDRMFRFKNFFCLATKVRLFYFRRYFSSNSNFFLLISEKFVITGIYMILYYYYLIKTAPALSCGIGAFEKEIYEPYISALQKLIYNMYMTTGKMI